MKVPECTGECCVSFPVPSYDRLAANPESYVDGAYTLAMLEPAAEAGRFTCRHFDPETRRCRAYAQRPYMCRSYPNHGEACEHCGGRLSNA